MCARLVTRAGTVPLSPTTVLRARARTEGRAPAHLATIVVHALATSLANLVLLARRRSKDPLAINHPLTLLVWFRLVLKTFSSQLL